MFWPEFLLRLHSFDWQVSVSMFFFALQNRESLCEASGSVDLKHQKGLLLPSLDAFTIL